MYKLVFIIITLLLSAGTALAECEPAIEVEESITPVACQYVTTNKILQADESGQLKETGVEIEYFGARIIIIDEEKIPELCKKGVTNCLKPTKHFLYKSDDKNICEKFKRGKAIKVIYTNSCCDETSPQQCKAVPYIITTIQ